LLLRLRFELDHYVNLRPVRLYPGVATPLAGVRPESINMVVVREGTEGPYAGAGGVLRRGTPAEVATQESLNTAFGVNRVVRYAFGLAMRRSRKHLTLVHKTNVLEYAGDLWQRTVAAVAPEFSEVTVDYSHVDAAAMFLVTDPERFDVIVTANPFGDIRPDLGAAVAGGIGLAASGNINPERTAPSMFEPVHGSAPDLAGQQKADPTAAILSAAMLCEHLGFTAEAARIEQAAADDLVERQGAWAARSTAEVGDDIAERVAGGAALGCRITPRRAARWDCGVAGRAAITGQAVAPGPGGPAAPGTEEGPVMTTISQSAEIEFDIHISDHPVPAAERERLL